MKRILIISNNALNFSDSNGRTLLNLLDGLKNEHVFFHFYINNGFENTNFISESYSLSDREVLWGLKKLKFNLGNINAVPTKNNKNDKKPRKTALNMLIRNRIWSINIGFNKKLSNWIKYVNPDVIIFQAGDCLQLYKLTLKICKKFHCKLVIYNSEDYPYKNYDYFSKKEKTNLVYDYFKTKLENLTKNTYRLSSLNIFLTTDLLQLYKSKLGIEGVCIPNSSTLSPIQRIVYNKSKVIRYFGNLNNNREKSILEIVKLIQKHDLDFKIEIYSRDHFKAFDCYPFVEQKGFVNYDDLKSLILQADVNLHIESFDKFYTKDIENGCSTKIPDIICSNRIFLLYAPRTIYLSRLVKNNHLGYCASNTEELFEALVDISNTNINKYATSMLEYANNNYRLEKNSMLFARLFEESL